MSLSKLAGECQVCPYLETCNHKRMEAVGYLQPNQNELQANIQESLSVPHDYRQVKIAPNTEVTIDLKDLKKELEKSIVRSAGLYGGFFI